MYKKNQKYKKSKKGIFIKLAIILIALLALSVFGYFRYINSVNTENLTTTESQNNSDDEEKIDYSPPTEKEKQAAEDIKVKPQPDSEPNTEPTNSKRKVTPIITNASANSVNGYISRIFEEGGTCTAHFTKGSTKLSKSSKGFDNVSYTQCAPINIEDGFLSPGTWTIVLQYSSNTSEGSSDPQKVDI